MDADILAENASTTKCATSQETKYLVNSIVEAFSNFSKLSLPTTVAAFVDLDALTALVVWYWYWYTPEALEEHLS